MDSDRSNDEDSMKQRCEDFTTWLNENRERALWHRNQPLETAADVDKQIAILGEIEAEKNDKAQELKQLTADLRTLAEKTEDPKMKRAIVAMRDEVKPLGKDMAILFDNLIPEEREFLENISAAYKRFNNLCETLTALIENLTEKAKEEATKIPINLNLNITSLCDGKQIESAVIRRRKTSYLQQYRTVHSELQSKESLFETYEDAARFLLSETSDETVSTRFDEVMRAYEMLSRTLENRSRMLESQIAQYERYAKTFKTAYDLVLQLDSRVTLLSHEEIIPVDADSTSNQLALETSQHIKRVLARIQELNAMRDPGQELVDTAVTGNERVLTLLGKSSEPPTPNFHAGMVMSFDESDTAAVRQAHEETLVNERNQLVAKWTDIWNRLVTITFRFEKANEHYCNAAELADALATSLNNVCKKHAELLNTPLALADKRNALKQLLDELNDAPRECLNRLRELGDAGQYEAAFDAVRDQLQRSIAALNDADSSIADLDANLHDFGKWLKDTNEALNRTKAVYSKPSSRDSKAQQNGARGGTGEHKPMLSDVLDGVRRDAEALQKETENAGRSKSIKLSRAVDNLASALGEDTTEVRARKQDAESLNNQLAKLSEDVDALIQAVPASIKRSRELDATTSQISQWLADAKDKINKCQSAVNPDVEKQLTALRNLSEDAANQHQLLNQMDLQVKTLLQTLPSDFDSRMVTDTTSALKNEFEEVQSRVSNLMRNLDEQNGQRKKFDAGCDALRQLIAAHREELQRVEAAAANTYEVHPVPGYLMDIAQALRGHDRQAQRDFDHCLSELQAATSHLGNNLPANVRQEQNELCQAHAELHQRREKLLGTLDDLAKRHDRFASARAALQTHHDDIEGRIDRLSAGWHTRQAQRDRKTAEEHCSDWLTELNEMQRSVRELVDSAALLRNKRAASDADTTVRRHDNLCSMAKDLLNNIAADNREMNALENQLNDTANWLKSARTSISRPQSRSSKPSRHASPAVNGNLHSDGLHNINPEQIEALGRVRLDELIANASKLYLKMNPDECARVKGDIAALQEELDRILRQVEEEQAQKSRLSNVLKRFEGERKRLEEAANADEENLDTFFDMRPSEEVATKLQNLLRTVQQDEKDARVLCSNCDELQRAGLLNDDARDALAALVNRFTAVMKEANRLLDLLADPESTYKAWHADFRKCVAMVDDVERLIDGNTNRALQRTSERKQLVAEWQKDLNRAQSIYKDLKHRTDRGGLLCTPEQRSSMKNDMDRLSRKFDRVRSALRDFLKAKTRTDPNAGWAIFDALANALKEWLAEAEKAAKLVGAPANDRLSRQAQSRKLKDLESEMSVRHSDVEQLAETHREANLVMPNADKMQVLVDVRARFGRLAAAIGEVRTILDASDSRYAAYRLAHDSCEKALLEASSTLIQLSQHCAGSRMSGISNRNRSASPIPLCLIDQCESALRMLDDVSSMLPSLEEQAADVARLGNLLMAQMQDDPITSSHIEREVAHVKSACTRVQAQTSQLNEEYSSLLSKWRMYFDLIINASNFLTVDVPEWLQKNKSLPATEATCTHRTAEAVSLLERVRAIADDLIAFGRYHFATLSNTESADQQMVQLARQLEPQLASCQSLLTEAIENLRNLGKTKQMNGEFAYCLGQMRDWVAAAEKELYCAIEDQMTNTNVDRKPIEALRAALPVKRRELEELRRAAKRNGVNLADSGVPESAFDELAQDLEKLSESIAQHLAAQSSRRSSQQDRTSHDVLRSITPRRSNGDKRRSSTDSNDSLPVTNLSKVPSMSPHGSVSRKIQTEKGQPIRGFSPSQSGFADESGVTRDASSQTIKNRKVQTEGNASAVPVVRQPLMQIAQSTSTEESGITPKQFNTMLEVMRNIHEDLHKNVRHDSPSVGHHKIIEHHEDEMDTCNVCGSAVSGRSLANSRIPSRMQSPIMSPSRLFADDSRPYTPTQWPSVTPNFNDTRSNSRPDLRAKPVVATRSAFGLPNSTYQSSAPSKRAANGTPSSFFDSSIARNSPSGSWLGQPSISPYRPGSTTEMFESAHQYASGGNTPSSVLSPRDYNARQGSTNGTYSPLDRFASNASRDNYYTLSPKLS